MEKLTKHQFEEKLYRLNKNKLLDYDTLRENGSLLHLYYNDEGHIGTWQRGGHYHIFHNNLPYTDGDAVWHTTGYSDEMLLNKMNIDLI